MTSVALVGCFLIGAAAGLWLVWPLTASVARVAAKATGERIATRIELDSDGLPTDAHTARAAAVRHARIARTEGDARRPTSTDPLEAHRAR